MERIRAVTATTAEESSPPEVFAVEPRVAAPSSSLRERVEVVTSPGVTREDVDSLLDGLSAPLAPGESTRERANQLLRLLQDEALGDLTGGDERQVRPLALEALIGLGFPYALEVPPEVLARMRSGARALSRSSRWGLGLTVVTALVPLLAQVVSTSPSRWWYDPAAWEQLQGPAILAGVMFLPAVLSALGERYRQKWLKYLGNVGLVLMSAVGLIPGIVMSRNGVTPEGVTFLGAGLALLTSAICLRYRPELED